MSVSPDLTLHAFGKLDLEISKIKKVLQNLVFSSDTLSYISYENYLDSKWMVCDVGIIFSIRLPRSFSLPLKLES